MAFRASVVVLSLCAAGAVWAGPLNPAAGPVASTNKTLTEVEPRIALSSTNTPGAPTSVFKITQPGSYYLTANLTSVPGFQYGIEIASSNVTIDLNGFQVVGGGGSITGIAATIGGPTNITIRNGTVRGWPGRGIDLIAFGAANCRIEGIIAHGNFSDGIALSYRAIISNCFATNNGQSGFVTANDTRITNCHAANNTLTGFEIGAGSAISHCIATNNTGAGFSLGSGSVIESCESRSNGSHGITATGSCLVARNLCESNGAMNPSSGGIRVSGQGNRIEDNVCNNGARGLSIDSTRNIIIRNTCSGNANNFSIVADNRYGPILNLTGAGSAAASGSSAAGTLTSADATANYAH